jgi:hypothetical protein
MALLLQDAFHSTLEISTLCAPAQMVPAAAVGGVAVLVVALAYAVGFVTKSQMTVLAITSAVVLASTNAAVALVFGQTLQFVFSLALSSFAAGIIVIARVMRGMPLVNRTGKEDPLEAIIMNYFNQWRNLPQVKGEQDVAYGKQMYERAAARFASAASSVNAIKLEMSPFPPGHPTYRQLKARLEVVEHEMYDYEAQMLGMRDVYAHLVAAFDRAQHADIFLKESAASNYVAMGLLERSPAALAAKQKLEDQYGQLMLSVILSAVRSYEGAQTQTQTQTQTQSTAVVRQRAASTPRV